MKTQEKHKNKEEKIMKMQENKMISKMKQNKRNNINSIGGNNSSFDHFSNNKCKCNIW